MIQGPIPHFLWRLLRMCICIRIYIESLE
jgi:hypothetical protein